MTRPLLARPNRGERINGYLQVLLALMLRDMRTRFGGSHWGYAVVVCWPIAHVFMLVAIFNFRHLPCPMGDSLSLFVATGAVPVLMFQYISREVMKSIISNKPLTYYPQVKALDVITARILVEIVTGFTALIIVVAILFALGVNPIPVNPLVSLSGYLAAMMLGIGIGIVNVGIISFFPGWLIGYILFVILLYILSGVMFMPNYLPQEIYAVLKFIPTTQIVEWVRLGYEPSLQLEVDYVYVLGWCAGSFLLGLILERFVVRQRG